MIVLDTNVVSEIIRSKPDLRALNWLKSYAPTELFISVLTITEMKYGVALLPSGADKQILNSKIDDILRLQFAGQILAFDEAAATLCAELMANKKAHTPLVKIVDLQIAATALAAGFSVATRDINDFQHTGLTLINPWAD